MGNSASIARKYQPRDSRGIHGSSNIDDDHESLSTVASYRPTSPLAHSDAQNFTFPTPNRPSTRNGYSMYNGSIGSYHRATPPSSTPGTPRLHSMRDVNHFLVRNPDLLNRNSKKSKRMVDKYKFDDIENHKQIKTKQDLYMGLFEPPTIYGKGVDPEKQLKINQRTYLQLIHPTYGQQYYKPYRPLIPDNMIVVRKDVDMRRPSTKERTRPPLKGMEVTRATPASLMASQRRTPMQRNERFLSPSKSPRLPIGHTLPASTPLPNALRHRRNEYIDMSDKSFKMKKQTPRLSKLSTDLMEVERRFETPTNSLSRSTKSKPKPIEDEIVFDYTVEELGLKKKSNRSKPSLSKDSVGSPIEPLYFRKSLAYNPRFYDRGHVLSDPL